jgi:hypothetical protein
MLRNLASRYRRCTVVAVIGIAIDVVPGKCIAAAGDDELALLSRTVTSATQNTRVHRDIAAATHEWLHVINIEVLPRIRMDEAALFTDIVRRAAAKVISPGGEHPILPIAVQDLLALSRSERNTRWGCHRDLLVGDRQCTPGRLLVQSGLQQSTAAGQKAKSRPALIDPMNECLKFRMR